MKDLTKVHIKKVVYAVMIITLLAAPSLFAARPSAGAGANPQAGGGVVPFMTPERLVELRGAVGQRGGGDEGLEGASRLDRIGERAVPQGRYGVITWTSGIKRGPVGQGDYGSGHGVDDDGASGLCFEPLDCVGELLLGNLLDS